MRKKKKCDNEMFRWIILLFIWISFLLYAIHDARIISDENRKNIEDIQILTGMLNAINTRLNKLDTHTHRYYDGRIRR